MTTLDHLETFVEVALSGSFAEVARKLSVPRSTVTARVKALENDLAVALFHRTTRQVRLTAEGEQYLADVQPALRSLMAAGEGLKSKQSPKGTVRMTVPVDLAQPGFAKALSEFQSRYAEIELQIHVSDQPVDLIREGFDLALRGYRVEQDQAVVRKIASNTLVIVARPEVVQDGSFKPLLAAGAVLDPIGALGTEQRRLPTAARIRTRNFQMARELARTMDVAAVLPRALCSREISSGTFIELETDLELPDIPLFLVLPTGRHVPNRVRLLVDHLVQAFR